MITTIFELYMLLTFFLLGGSLSIKFILEFYQYFIKNRNEPRYYQNKAGKWILELEKDLRK